MDDAHRFRSPPVRPGESLEIAVDFPARPAAGGAVLFGPYPLLGGDLDNNVLSSLAAALVRSGRPVLRFNYRAVGRSLDVDRAVSRFDHWHRVDAEGDFGPALEDAAEALRRAGRLFDVDVLIGYSFGAWIAHRVDSPAARILVCPPVDRHDLAGAAGRVIVAGDDALTGRPDPVRFPAAVVHVVEGADHFFRDREADLAGLVLELLDVPPAREGSRR